MATLSVVAQPSKKIPRLCFLTFDPGTLQSRSPRFDAFFNRLSELGYIAGQTVAIDYLSAGGSNDLFPTVAAECLRLKADVIAVTTTPGAHAARAATRSTPIVMLSLGDPVGTGLVENLARPEGNVTGMAQMTSELAPKRLALLKEAVPSLSRVLVLSYLVDPIAPLQVMAMEAAARSLGVWLKIHEIRTGDDLPSAFEAAVRDGCDGVITTTESIFVVNRALLSNLAARHNLPAIYPWALIVTDAGGLMAYDVNEPDLHRRAADYVDRIFKGAKATDLPVQRPTNLRLVVNLQAAKALGIKMPASILTRADEVIE
jgi:putative ABC transport system substrate-binding protein